MENYIKTPSFNQKIKDEMSRLENNVLEIESKE
jgi:hypothetical protein